MERMIFVNLPVVELSRATDFYEGLGFTKNPQFSDDKASCVVISDTIYVMLLRDDFYKSFLAAGDTSHLGSGAKEVLNALGCESRSEVDALVKAATGSGGTIYRPAAEQMPGMYSASVADPDEHLWEFFYMESAG